MKKWSLRIGTFLLSLVLGLGTGFVIVSRTPISLCDVDASPDKYTGKIVRLRVVVSNSVFTGGPIASDRLVSACSFCAGKDVRRPWANVDLDPQQINLVRETTRVWHGEHLWQDGRAYLTEVILVGRFEEPPGTHCFGPKYYLSEARIERVIAEHEFENVEQGTQWLESNSR